MTKRINKHVDELNINGLKVIYCFDDIMQTKPPVAGWDSRGAFRSNKRYSEFTESMINAYLGGDDTIIWDSPTYQVLDYFDTREDAQDFIKLQKEQKQ